MRGLREEPFGAGASRLGGEAAEPLCDSLEPVGPSWPTALDQKILNGPPPATDVGQKAVEGALAQAFFGDTRSHRAGCELCI